MKILNKFKKYIFLFAFAILGVFAFNSDLVGATGFYPVGSIQGFNLTNTGSSRVWTTSDTAYYNHLYYYDFNDNMWKTNDFTWNGIISIDGANVWNIGNTYYYSYNSSQYVIDLVSKNLIPMTWNGLTSFNGSYVWNIGNTYYCSYNSTQYVLDISTNTWSPMTWNGLTSFNGVFVWNIGNTYYYSGGTSSTQYVLDISTNTWSPMTWNGLTSFSADSVWFYNGVYYTGSSTSHYLLDISTNTWSRADFDSLTSFNGSYHWSFNGNVYMTNYGVNYKFSETPITIGQYNSTDLENAYNNGYTDGYNDGVNLGINAISCDVTGLVNNGSYNCTDMLSTIFVDGKFDFSSLRSYLDSNSLINDRYNVSVIFDFVNNYSDFVVAGLSTSNTGSYVSFYNNDRLLYTYDLTTNVSWVYLEYVMSIGFDEIVFSSANYDNSVSTFNFYTVDNFENIFSVGRTDGYNNGYDVGYTEGYDIGYNNGYYSGQDSNNTIIGLVGAIFTGPVTMLTTIFNFEFLGINLSGLILSLTTLLVVIWLIKRFI